MKFILAIVFYVMCFSLIGSHIIGGNFKVTQTGPNLYNIELTVFRDYCASSTPFDAISEMEIGIFNKSNNTLSQSIFPSSLDSTVLSFTDPCFTPSICVSKGVYTFNNINMPNNPAGYYIVWERCCRNSVIVNINDPGNAGMAFYAEIPDPALTSMNSSPVFGPYPTNSFLCVNSQKTIDFSTTDPDGDSLVYSFVTPKKGNTGPGTAPPTIFNNSRPIPYNNPFPAPYPPVIWNSGYGNNTILGAGGSMTINSSTGLITATAPVVGLFVFAVRVEEYRNGVKIGEVVREIQFEGVNCTGDDLPVYASFPDTIFIDYKSSACFDFVVNDANTSDSIIMEMQSNAYVYGAQSGLPNPIQTVPDTLYPFTYYNTVTGLNETVTQEVWNPVTNIYYGYGRVGASFCWNPKNCEVLENESYDLNLNTYSFGCDGTDTVSKTVKVIVNTGAFSSYVPNVFSPNGDGKNDEFYLGGSYNECYDVIDIKIYNRWGELVYESTNPQFRWDGTNKSGAKLTGGTYYAILQGYYGNQEVTNQFPITLFR